MSGTLTIMGSGELSPTMVSVHRRVTEALRPRVSPAVLIDTPYGFQENADEITAKTVGYFATSVNVDLDVASLRHVSTARPAEIARFEDRLRLARFVFAGPGSPTYALEQWRPTEIGPILGDRLRNGAAVTFASAAAVTLGRVALPVYEIYKVGRDPYLVEGLDVLGALGIDGIVVPHFDNAEGGTHDTRFCYLGRRRFEALESRLGAATSVIGVDEHTACTIDFSAERILVSGRGGLTVKRAGDHHSVAAGDSAPLDLIRSQPQESPSHRPPRAHGSQTGPTSPDEAVELAEKAFADLADPADIEAAVDALLELEESLHDSSGGISAGAGDRARSALRALIVRLGDAAGDGLLSPRSRVAPFVEVLLDLRNESRRAADWQAADEIRARLGSLGIDIRDTPTHSEWDLDP